MFNFHHSNVIFRMNGVNQIKSLTYGLSKARFFEYSTESQRVRANLEQTYAAWVDAKRQADAMPVSMYWSSKEGADYLCIKQTSQDNGSSVVRRSPQLEAQYQSHVETKARLKERIHLPRGRRNYFLGFRFALRSKAQSGASGPRLEGA